MMVSLLLALGIPGQVTLHEISSERVCDFKTKIGVSGKSEVNIVVWDLVVPTEKVAGEGLKTA